MCNPTLIARAAARSFSTLPSLQQNSVSVVRNSTYRPAQAFIRAQRGDPRRRFVSTAGALAFAFFFANCVMTRTVSATNVSQSLNGIERKTRYKPFGAQNTVDHTIRGGDIVQSDAFDFSQKPTPPIDFAHGTTTLAFTFQGGIVAAVDSRAR